LGGPVIESPNTYVFSQENWNNHYFNKNENIKGEAIYADLIHWYSNKERISKAIVDLFNKYTSFKQITFCNQSNETINYFQVLAPRMKELYKIRKPIIVYQINPSAPILRVETFSDFLLECWNQCLGHQNQLYWSIWPLKNKPYYGLCSYSDTFSYELLTKSGKTPKIIDLEQTSINDNAIREIYNLEVQITVNLGGCKLGVVKVKFADNFESINYINLESTNITNLSVETIVNYLKMENIRYVNVQDTPFSRYFQHHFEEFKCYVDNDPYLVSKLIWMSPDEEVYNKCLENFPNRYVELIKNNHRVFDIYRDWYNHLKHVYHTAEILNKL
jgi:hypothetical protein